MAVHTLPTAIPSRSQDAFQSIERRDASLCVSPRDASLCVTKRDASLCVEPRYTIIVVDDEEVVRTVLIELLKKKGYVVYGAHDGLEALEMLETIQPDMIISDIKMPGMDGFTLLKKVEDHYPHIKRILMTGYDIDSYFELVKQYHIGNIIPKGSEFRLDDVGAYVASLLSGDYFGLEKYFAGAPIQSRLIRTPIHVDEVCSQITAHYPARDRGLFEIALNELISNAILHGVLQLTTIPREMWPDEYALTPQQAVRVSWAFDKEKIGVSVEDPRGNLRKNDVLLWLDHQIKDQLKDWEHGRGFMLVRKIIDRFIINIRKGERTECIAIQNFDRTWKNNSKPLLIHEL